MKRRFPVWLLIVVALVGVGIALRLRSSTPTTFPGNVEAFVRAEKDRQKIPGMAVVIIRDGTIAYEGYFGEADWRAGVKVSKDTTFRLASLAKPMTAAAVMELVEQGKIDLDAPIQKYVPTFPKKQWPITVRQILGHLSGIRHYIGDEQYPQGHCSSVTESLALFAKDPLEHEPGTRYLYSTYGYSLLGVAIENVSQSGYVDYMQKHIFQPSGMTGITVDDITKTDINLAGGYFHDTAGSLDPVSPYDTTCRVPGAGFRGPIGDVAQFVLAMMDDRLLKAKTRELMWTAQHTKAGEAVPYGIGWQMDVWKGERVAYHTGTQPGFSSEVWMLPERKFAVILVTNLHGALLLPHPPMIADMVFNKPASQ